MCGRYSLVTTKQKIQKQLPQVAIEDSLKNSYNIAPTHHAYIITNDSPNRLQYLTWGLIPYWSKDGKNQGKMINARMEGIESKPSFRVPIRQRKCLVIADSFYEWKRVGGKKIPYRILLRSDQLMVMAGIWDVWYKGNYAIKSFSIITKPPNEEMAVIHNRMPVFLQTKDEQQAWLMDQQLDSTLALLNKTEDGILKMYCVSEKVGSVKNNTPDLHRELPEPLTLF